jgi:hypothetical protein
MKNVKLGVGVGFAVVLMGCAHMHSRTVQYGPDGKPTAMTDASATTVFDSQNSLTKFSNHAGTNNGSFVSGLSENANGSNAVLAIQELGAIAGVAAK